MAKKRKATPKVDSAPAEPKYKRPCFMCDGAGMMCNICGETTFACGCDEVDMRDCEDCEGTGVASADRDGTEPHC